MAGTWLSMVEGFAGIRIEEDTLIINPLIPKAWKNYSFQILFKNNPIIISVSKEQVLIENRGQQSVKLLVNGNLSEVQASEKLDLQTSQIIKL
jgi:maltose phosphorylase